jgi:hypothetical protein
MIAGSSGFRYFWCSGEWVQAHRVKALSEFDVLQRAGIFSSTPR